MIAARRPCVVELVGPAGAGKSTLVRALPAHTGDAPGLTLWGLPRSLLLAGAVGVMPAVAAAAWTRPLRGAAVSQMIRLAALRHALARRAAAGARLIVLDEGPVFALSWLDVFHARDTDHSWRAWRRRTLAEWAGRLDVVVRLDADDRVLAERIRTRAKPHPVKQSSDAEIFRFLACFRRAFDRVIAELMEAGPVRVLRLEPDVESPDLHASRLLGALEEVPGGR